MVISRLLKNPPSSKKDKMNKRVKGPEVNLALVLNQDKGALIVL